MRRRDCLVYCLMPNHAHRNHYASFLCGMIKVELIFASVLFEGIYCALDDINCCDSYIDEQLVLSKHAGTKKRHPKHARQ